MRRGRCKIERADFQEFLKSLRAGSVGLVLTDPPYAISRKTGFASVKNGERRFAVSMDFGKWDHAEVDLSVLCASLHRVLRRGGTAIIWYDLWKLTPLRDALEVAGFTKFRQIVWQKKNPVPLNSKRTYLSNSREMAVVASRAGGGGSRCLQRRLRLRPL